MIETQRLIIRPFQPQDGAALHAYLSNPAIYQYEPGEPISLERAMELAAERSLSKNFWAVVLKKTKVLVGHLYFHQIDQPEFLTWELGYIFNPAYHNQGFASESSAALIAYGFAHWGIHRVAAYCNPENVASWRVMEKIGMRREGLMRKNVSFRRDADGTPLWEDSYAYALLAEESRRS